MNPELRTRNRMKSAMIFGEVAGLGKPVSRLVQGTMMLSSETLDASLALLDAVFEQGCNTFDTAHVYGGGDCERVLGRWVAERGIRDRVVIITKGAHPNADRNRVTPFDITSDLHDSLARLGAESIDLYLLHRDDPSVEVGPLVEILNEHRRAGKIRAFGGSNWTHERIAEANAYAQDHGLVGFAASSPQYSLVEMVEVTWDGCVGIGGEQGKPARAWYAANGMPVFPWSSLGRGFLSGRYRRADYEAMPADATETFVRSFRSESNLERLDRAFGLAREKGATLAQIGLAYLLHQPVSVFPLIGCVTGHEFRSNAQALDLQLTPAELAWLNLDS